MNGTAQFVLRVNMTEGEGEVVVSVEPEPEFLYWMCAAEFFLGLAASKSPAGFERALDLIREGAIRGWKRRRGTPG